ncbi:MAG: NAD(P)-dependent alcohol dehydrogenase [Planctomycetota bacterium]
MRRYVLRAQPSGKLTPICEEIANPEAGAGEVLVAMKAASLNYRDLLVTSGNMGGDGIVPLSDGAGEVIAVGEGVAKFQVGDRVALTFFNEWDDGPFDMLYHRAARGGSSDGVMAEFVAAKANGVVKIPDHLSDVEAACLPCAALTAWQALFERGQPFGEGQSLLCLGTGGVSVCALQMATAAGGEVIITSSSDEKLERAKELGAAHTINYKSVPDWDQQAWGLTNKRGVNHVMEVGGPGTFEKSMKAVGAGGTISMIGVLTGFDPSPAGLFPLVSKAVNLHGIYVGSHAMFERMNAFLAEHQIKPIVDRVFPFGELTAAYDYLESGSHFGKVVVEIG